MHHIKPTILKPDGNPRSGRGFSLKELERSGITSVEAKKLKLPVDKRRKTAHDQNIEIIKSYVKKRKLGIKSKPNNQKQIEKKAKK